MNSIIVIHYAEIGLKGENRREFEKKLVDNIRLALKDLNYKSINRISGRILIPLESGAETEAFKTALNHVFGIAHFSFGWEVESDI